MLNTLHKLLNELKRNGNVEGKPKAAVHRLNSGFLSSYEFFLVSQASTIQFCSSGIHRVVQVMQNSGYEDDFTFRAPSPLRLRSKSTLHIKAYEFIALFEISES